MAGAESQRLPFTLHDDYAPNWDFTFGGSKLILTCSLNEMNGLNHTLPHAQLHVSFGGEQVSPEATIELLTTIMKDFMGGCLCAVC